MKGEIWNIDDGSDQVDFRVAGNSQRIYMILTRLLNLDIGRELKITDQIEKSSKRFR